MRNLLFWPYVIINAVFLPIGIIAMLANQNPNPFVGLLLADLIFLIVGFLIEWD